MLKRVFAVLMFLALGGVLVFFGGRQIAEGYASRNWLPTAGTVIDSHVKSETVTKKSGNSRRTTTEYTTTIRYNYTVGGIQYTGDRLSVERSGYRGTNRGSAYNLAERYPVASAVTVHYDPRNPATSVLQAGAAGFGSWFMVAIGVIIMAGTAVIAFFVRRRAAAPSVVVRVPPANGFGAPALRTARPINPAAVPSWQPGAVPRGVITDWTANFLGAAEAWQGAQASVSNLHGFWGGRQIELTGDGRATIRLTPASQGEQRHDFDLAPDEARQLLGLFARQDFLTITFPSRPLVPDEGATTLTLRNTAGQEFTLTRHDHDLDEGGRYAAIAAPLLALADRLAAVQPASESGLAAK